MASNPDADDEEMSAMQAAYVALRALDKDAQARALGYIQSRLGLNSEPARAPPRERKGESAEMQTLEQHRRPATKYDTFAELFDAAHPTSNADKVLVAGYWLQVCQGAESFDGQSANTELKNLGHGVANITNAVDALKSQKPALALQLKKSGTSQQARKTYKITVAGMKAVDAMGG